MASCLPHQHNTKITRQPRNVRWLPFHRITNYIPPKNHYFCVVFLYLFKMPHNMRMHCCIMFNVIIVMRLPTTGWCALCKTLLLTKCKMYNSIWCTTLLWLKLTNLFAVNFNICYIVLKDCGYIDFWELVFAEDDQKAGFTTGTITNDHQLLSNCCHPDLEICNTMYIHLSIKQHRKLDNLPLVPTFKRET